MGLPRALEGHRTIVAAVVGIELALTAALYQGAVQLYLLGPDTSPLARYCLIVAMTTPYGTTTFRRDTDVLTSALFKFIEATDPAGGRERVEFQLFDDTLAETAPGGEVPTGFSCGFRKF